MGFMSIMGFMGHLGLGGPVYCPNFMQSIRKIHRAVLEKFSSKQMDGHE